ncbi:MAG: hypothetical protein L0H93_12845 [Nocardioides sp.]|nr:hypothetical protein [Nocardioides sp.]
MNALLLTLADDDKAPAAKDVVAGWTGFAVFLGLIVVVALLCWSMIRQLRKAQAAKDAGVYGDEPATSQREDGDSDVAGPTSTDQAPTDQAPADHGSDS